MTARVAVVGGGITALAAVVELAESPGVDVTLFDAAPHLGGLIATSPFAGLGHVDEASDAFLARVPDAVAFARRVGLGDELVSPEPVGASVWYGGRLHPIPDGLLLGVPGRLRPLAASRLLSWRGTARAALEPLLPRTSIAPDSIGAFVRARFGDEVHERLVDSLVGSIYAADTDRFSLGEVPQLAALAAGSRSVLLAARRQRASAGTATAAASPVFATPREGMSALVTAAARAAASAGATLHHDVEVASVEPADGPRWRLVAGDASTPLGTFDQVVFATPAAATAGIVADVASDAAMLLGRAERADVVMVTLHIAADQWPAGLRAMSGYLVPKPAQRDVTAVSFASQKWAHWRPPGGGEILRVSIGRDAVPVLHLDDAEIQRRVLDDLERHLGVRFAPLATRITRWPGAFAQYRPHHASWVAALEHAMPTGLSVAGASYYGIGIPACVRSGIDAARRAGARALGLEESAP